MKTLTQSQLRDLLLAIRGTEPITITALTEVRAPRCGTPVYRMSRVNGITGADYGRAVNRLIPFVPKPRQWGTRISPHIVSHIVEGEERLYLTLKVERSLSSVYLAKHDSFLKVVREAELKGVLPKKDERPVIVRDYGLRAIKRIAIGGKRYRVIET